MITYLLQLTICWGLFYAAYHLFLKEETHFSFNRWYLLGALCLGLIIPLVDWGSLFIHQPDSLGQLYIAPLNSQMEAWDVTVTAAASRSVNWYEILKWVYVVGAFMTAVKLIRSWQSILVIRQQSDIHRHSEYDLILTDESHMPFSFLGSIYCSREYYENSPDIDHILIHEEYHIKAWHSADIIYSEILKVLFWFHPLVYLFKKALQQIHEYQADRAACHMSTKKRYGRLLLSHTSSGMPVSLANPFFNSQLKNRFKMMTKQPSTRKTMLKYLVILPLVGVAVLLFSYSSQGNSILDKISLSQDTIPDQTLEVPPSPPPPPHKVKKGEEEVFRVVEQMPHFPGCEEVSGNYQQEKACADRKMLEFLYKNIQYPEEARKNDVEGAVVVSFIVEKDGSISSPKAIRTPGAGLGEEAVRVVKMMGDLPEKWKPGVQKGKEVRVQFILPVKFELKNNEKKQEIATGTPPPPPPAPKQVKGQEEVFRVVEQMPRFPGCENVEGDNQQKKSCADRKMLEFIYTNVKYPEEARKDDVEGTVVVSFIVEKDGSIASPKIVRTPGAGLGEEAVRVVNMMSDLPEKWTPGLQRGHKVRVQYIIPIKFEIKDNNISPEGKEPLTRPLLVVDGEIVGKVDVKNLRESIDVKDVEAINIIKGESAIQKYGSKGQDGVIEITTKWEKQNQAASLDLTNVNIYPVPAVNRLNIEASVKANGQYRLEVRDLKGSIVVERKVTVAERTLRTNLDLSGLVAGPYSLIVSHSGKVFSRTFVKQ